MFYLQEKRLLQRYYQRFRDNAKDDPTGLESLKDIIAPQSLEEFEQAVAQVGDGAGVPQRAVRFHGFAGN